MKKIPLGQGRFALVDDEDLKALSRWKWTALWIKEKKICYAIRTATKTERAKGKKRTVTMHREIIKARPGFQVDHKNQNGLDNRRANLRECTAFQNQMNRKNTKNKNGVPKGVTWNKIARKWYARIRVEGKNHFLGSFTSMREASKIYQRAAKKFFGKFARFH